MVDDDDYKAAIIKILESLKPENKEPDKQK